MTQRTPRSDLWLRTRLRGAVTRADVLIFSGAMAISALHVAVDSFIAPQPGTHAADDLLRGLVSGHVGGLEARPSEYEQRVIGFFDRALLEKSG